MNQQYYVNFIRNTVEQEGLEIANEVNHKAYAMNIITLEFFLAAADILAQIIINR